MESKPVPERVTGYLASENLHVEYSVVVFTLVTAQTVVLLLMTYLNIFLSERKLLISIVLRQ